MERDNSLLNKIRSKYILKKILSLAYGDLKSVVIFTKYNKKLMNDLDLDIKKFQDNHQYEFSFKLYEKSFCLNYVFLIKDIIIFISWMI